LEGDVQLPAHGGTERLAAGSTFISMADIIFVNPAFAFDFVGR